MAGSGDIVILTGAGISADSGVDTFRDSGGVWSQYDYREVATPEGFAANPALVHEFYNMRRAGLPKVEPNPAHFALAALETAMAEQGRKLTLVTQNVDDLHERGGSQRIIHMHGSLTQAICTACENIFTWRKDMFAETPCPACETQGTLRPNIVWFGEMPMEMMKIHQAIDAASLFVSIGTSGSVYPAAGFVAEAARQNIPCMELNLEPSENARLFDNARYGPAAEIVPQWVDEMKEMIRR